MSAAALIIAAFREDLAGYVRTLAFVYVLLIIAYILSSMYQQFGGRVPYSRATSAVLGFLRDVVEPFLAIFRRFVPMIGPLDLSPIVAIFVVQIVAGIVAALIEG